MCESPANGGTVFLAGVSCSLGIVLSSSLTESNYSYVYWPGTVNSIPITYSVFNDIEYDPESAKIILCGGIQTASLVTGQSEVAFAVMSGSGAINTFGIIDISRKRYGKFHVFVWRNSIFCWYLRIKQPCYWISWHRG